MAIGRGDEGIFAVIEGIIAGIGEKASALGRAVADGLGNHGGGASHESSGSGFSLGSLLGFGGDKAEPQISAPQRQPEMQIAAPAKQICRFEVGMDELGTFAPPAVGNAARSAGMGMGNVA